MSRGRASMVDPDGTADRAPAIGPAATDGQYVLLVDAGYLFACAGRLVLQTTTRRDFRVDTPGFVAALTAAAAERLPGRLLRVYWFDASKDRVPTVEQRAVAQLPGVKLRLGNLNAAGQQKGVDAQVRADLETLARNHADHRCDPARRRRGHGPGRRGRTGLRRTRARLGGRAAVRVEPGRAPAVGGRRAARAWTTSSAARSCTAPKSSARSGRARRTFRSAPCCRPCRRRWRCPRTAPSGTYRSRCRPRSGPCRSRPSSICAASRRSARPSPTAGSTSAAARTSATCCPTRPRLPVVIDRDLLVEAEGELGTTLRGSEEARRKLRDGFWARLYREFTAAGDDQSGAAGEA